MTWDQLFQDIKEGHIANVYCFYGAEDYVKRSAMAALRKKLLPEGLEALNHTQMESPSMREVIEAAETMPMMADMRLVEVWDFAPLMAGRAKAEAEEAELLSGWIDNAPNTTCVVFVLRGAADGRKKAMQRIQKLGTAVSFDPLPDDKLGKWVREQLRPAGKSIRPSAIGELVLRAGRDLTKLLGELEKLSAYVGERKEIEKGDVEKLVAQSLESAIFQMIDQLMAGDQAGAQRMYRAMLELGETRVRILFMLTRQMRNLLHVKQIHAQKLPLSEASKRLGLAGFAAQRVSEQANRLSESGIRAAYQACLDAEFAIKAGKMRDTLAVDALMIQLGQLK